MFHPLTPLWYSLYATDQAAELAFEGITPSTETHRRHYINDGKLNLSWQFC